MIRYVDQITSEEYMNLRKMVGWVQFPLEEAQACIDNAYMVLCVRDDGKAIGVVRLLWDGGYIAFLSDVIVDPSYQGQGIGRKLVESCIERLKNDMKPAQGSATSAFSQSEVDHADYVGPNPPSGSTNQYNIYVFALKAPVEKVMGKIGDRALNLQHMMDSLDTDAEGNTGNIVAVGRVVGYFSYSAES